MVLPSHREGLPKILLEAGLSGRPVITTDVPGCRDVVINGMNGFIIPKDDAGLLSEKIIYLLTNKDLQTKMGIDGRDYVLNNFTTDIIMEEMLNIIEFEISGININNAIKEKNIK